MLDLPAVVDGRLPMPSTEAEAITVVAMLNRGALPARDAEHPTLLLAKTRTQRTREAAKGET